ncbi:extracellular solute-binding protein [Ferruginibacter paludis]|uniref:extracellular solute-binding protein n=1 Tax=Ferruginibacter paludis TaxID=1310417 RepID=UPI0025B3C008|nr:extracellular solute-binding protein [Ferruginibacter paludis]MDN3656923.1 extracellular solute-binding protein [Ferruginibacter paludis]
MIILNGITWDQSSIYGPLAAASKLYEEQFGIRVEWEKRPLSSFKDQSLPDLATKADLLIIQHPQTGVAGETNCLLNLDELLPYEQLQELEHQSAGPVFLSYYYQQKQWALPLDATMQCAASRPDLLDGHPVPTNWDEVFELAEILKQQHLNIGMALSATDCMYTFLSLAVHLGSAPRENNTLLVTKEVGMLVLEGMRKLRDNFHPKCLDWTPIELYDHMATEDDIPYSPLAFCYNNYSRDGFRKNRLRFHNAPDVKDVVLGGAGIAVSATTSAPAEAAKYAAWLCSAAVQNDVYVNAQGQPANIIAWKDPAANAMTDNFFSNTIDTLTYAYVRPRYNGWAAFEQYLGETLHTFLKHNSNAAEVLEQIQEAYHFSYAYNKKSNQQNTP